MNLFERAAVASLLLSCLVSADVNAAPSAIPGPPKPSYQRVFAQDFTTMSTLSVAPHDIGTGTWIAHTPSYQDWFTFQDPGAPFHPFGLDKTGLTIRVQKDGNDPHNWFSGFSGGLLSSMDGHGKGFAQKYGYYEASMQTPGGPNTWPAFWLLDAPSLTDTSLPYGAEVDVTESYGNYGTGAGQKPAGDPDQDGVTWHLWGRSGNPSSGQGIFVHEPGMTTGFHTYGVDVEPDTITWYFDRKQVWQVPTYEAARRPLFVLVNLALGGGTHNNADGTDYDWNLTPNPSDLKVRYIAVWASPNSPNYAGKPAMPTELKAYPGDSKVKLAWAGGGQSFDVYRGLKAGRADMTKIATGLTDSSYLDSAVKNGSQYYYQVDSANPYGAGPRSPAISAVPAEGAGAAATFVKSDKTTQGSWKGAYGADGYAVFGDKTSYPADAKVTASTTQTFTWPPSTDVRALQKGAPSTDRIVAELHADTTLTFDIDLTDGKTHQIAMYFLDWDRKGESNGVQIKDAVFGDVLDNRTFSDFVNGQYEVWTVKGHVQISITNDAPHATNSQATLSGLFFDTPK